jgi:hypothetical protein
MQIKKLSFISIEKSHYNEVIGRVKLNQNERSGYHLS